MSARDPSGGLLIDSRRPLGHLSLCGYDQLRGRGVSRTIRTLILASSEPLRQALRDLLLIERDFEVLGVAATRHEAKNVARQHRPDLLVYALEPTALNRLLFLREVEAVSPRTHVFFCSLHHGALDDLRRRADGKGANRPS